MTLNSVSGIRRQALPSQFNRLAAVALGALLTSGCSQETAAVVRLPNTQTVVAKLVKLNNTLTGNEYQKLLIDLVNAFNTDVAEQFGGSKPTEYKSFDELRISEAHELALRNGVFFAFYPTQDAKSGLYAIDVTVKGFLVESPNIKVAQTADLLPGLTWPTNVPVLKMSTAFKTSGSYDPVGTVILYREVPTILIDEDQVRKNAKTALGTPDDAVYDVILNETAHVMLMNFLGMKPGDSQARASEIQLKDGTRAPLLQIEEAFSDYITLSQGRGSLAYQLLTYGTRTGIGQYGLTNRIFTEGVTAGVNANADLLSRRGLQAPFTMRRLASLIYADPYLAAFEKSLRQYLIAAYEAFFKANLSQSHSAAPR